MVDFRRLADTDFSVVESVKTYLGMILYLSIPIIKTALLSTVFILFGQALFSLIPQSTTTNICFWVWVGFVFSVSTASFFKTSEDLILNKTAQIYANVANVFIMSAKLFAVVAMIVGALVLLILPMYYLKNPLYTLPYKMLACIFIIAAIPFVYFAPLAVALREANVFNSFTFSFYMVFQRWKNISRTILVQILFTAMVAFWAYFFVLLLFFPNGGDFYDFVFSQSSALVQQPRDLYVRFIFWEFVQIFVFTFISGLFIGINTILFLYFDGSIAKILLQENEIKVNRSKEKFNTDAKFVDMLEKSKPVNIDTKPEEEEVHHKTRKEVLNEIYPGYPEEESFSKPYERRNKSKSPSPDDDVIIIEDDYSK